MSDPGGRSCWVRRGRTWCIWCAGIGAERRQMGVQRIPLRLPRAAPVPLRPGSCSSSISPCIPSSLPRSLYLPFTYILSRASPLLNRASLLRLRNQARRSRRAPSILALAPTLQHRLNHLSFLLAWNKKFSSTVQERSCELSAIHENSIHVSRNFSTLNTLRADHT